MACRFFIKCIGVVFSFLLLNVFSVGYAQYQTYPRIAVMDFGNHSKTDDLLGEENAIADYLVVEFVNSGRFDIYEREALRNLLDEQALHVSGVIDPETAAEVGRLAGIKYLVYGNITNLSTKEERVSYENNSINTHKVMANIAGRVIDVETGRLVLAATGKGVSKSSNVLIEKHNIMIGTQEVSQESVHNALEKAAGNLVENLIMRMDGKKKK